MCVCNCVSTRVCGVFVGVFGHECVYICVHECVRAYRCPVDDPDVNVGVYVEYLFCAQFCVRV
jgi:hypothetical protein